MHTSRLLLPATIFTALSCVYSGCGNANGNLDLGGSLASKPTLRASPSKIGFGSTAVGSRSSRTLTLTNSGTETLTIFQLAATGQGFAVSTPSFPVSLSINQSVSVRATFAPSVGGPAEGIISISSNVSDSTATIPLAGTGVIGQLDLRPTTVSFGRVAVGHDAILPIILTNTGAANVMVSQVTVTGTGFAAGSLTLPLALVPGQDTNLSVTFTPTTVGSFTGSIAVVSSATNSPAIESLSGSGTTSHSVDLSWKASPSPNILGYYIFRSNAASAPFIKLNSIPISGTTYTDTTVQSGTYYYACTAVDSSGIESGYSNVAQATVP
jgi:hypothetical protein